MPSIFSGKHPRFKIGFPVFCFNAELRQSARQFIGVKDGLSGEASAIKNNDIVNPDEPIV